MEGVKKLTKKDCLIMIRNNMMGELVAAEINERNLTRSAIASAGNKEAQEVITYQRQVKNRKQLIDTIDRMLLEEEDPKKGGN